MASNTCLKAHHRYRTTSTNLTDSHTFPWTLSIQSDPCHTNLLSSSSHSVSLPATVLSTLSQFLPDPNFADNNLNSIHRDIEQASFQFETTFSLPSGLSQCSCLLLKLQAIQFPATIYLNNEQLLSTINSFHPYTVLLKPNILNDNSLNCLRIEFPSVYESLQLRANSHTYREWNDPVGGISTLRVPQYLAGWDWGPRQLSQGIVAPISIIHVPCARIDDFACIQDVQTEPNTRVTLEVNIDVCVYDLIEMKLKCLLIPLDVEKKIKESRPDDEEISIIQQLLNSENKFIDVVEGQSELIQVNELDLMSSSTFRDEPEELNSDGSKSPQRYGHPPLTSKHILGEESNRLSNRRYRCGVNVNKPKLWWPNGMGEQHLYALHVVVLAYPTDLDGVVQNVPIVVDSRSTKIGLRKLELILDSSIDSTRADIHNDCDNDDRGKEKIHNTEAALDKESERSVGAENEQKQSFMFAVNGRQFFAKGANYIPMQMQYHQTTQKEYEYTIQSVCEANMNMLRVWGGGIYEQDIFYELCDQYGILLWHDFMFSCSLYPGDEEFLESCRTEAEYQVSRLRNHACMALWCGNNELEQVPHDILKSESTKLAYDKLFYDILLNVVENDLGNISYWPSSPHNPCGYDKGFNNPNAGDTHFWDVWHARKPVSSYLQHRSRFCSEFGMQSYLSEAAAKAFAGSEWGALNPFGPIMEAHQKNASGNLIIMEYCQRLFRAPKDYSSLSYQSQLNQMICMRTGVEHFRRCWPYCAGALYWQLNDCWPCFSWSSIEFGGNWKALHYGASLFYAPLLVSVVNHGNESVGVCNIISFSDKTGLFSIFASFDGVECELSVTLSYNILNINTGEGSNFYKEKLDLKRDTSRKIADVNIRRDSNVEKDPRSHVLRANLESACGRYRSSTTEWFCSPRLCHLRFPELRMTIEKWEVNNGLCKVLICVQSCAFAPFVELLIKSLDTTVPGEDAQESGTSSYVLPTSYKLSENFFDVFPDEPKRIELTLYDEITKSNLLSRLHCRSLLDSYMM